MKVKASSRSGGSSMTCKQYTQTLSIVGNNTVTFNDFTDIRMVVINPTSGNITNFGYIDEYDTLQQDGSRLDIVKVVSITGNQVVIYVSASTYGAMKITVAGV